MVDVHEPIWRNGEVLTRQHWQHYDRLNEKIGGQLVIVQGGMSSAPDSGTTHRLLGVVDYRRWNLSNSLAHTVVIEGRNLCGATHERFTWQGFDPHFHECLLGDDIPGVMDSLAIGQCETYKAGGDGVAGTVGDVNPYRPTPIKDYEYLEDDVTPEEHRELFRIGERLDQFAANELLRDRAEADRDKRRFTALITAMGKSADQLTVAINQAQDDATKNDLRRAKETILLALKEDPDVTGVDNPDDDQMP